MKRAGAEVWPYFRADCPQCPDWRPDYHLSGFSAALDAEEHNRQHEAAEMVVEEVARQVG